MVTLIRGLLLCAVLPTLAGAAQWTCHVRTRGLGGGGTLAVAGCDGVGTYTTGGDPVGDGSKEQVGTQLCGTHAGVIDGVWPSLGFRADGKALLLLFNRTTGKFQVYVAPATPAAGAPFEEAPAGTQVGASIATVAMCR